MHERSRLLADESIGKLLFKLSAPATIGMLVQALYNLVDTIFVGHALGENSIQGIAGIAVSFPIMMIVMAIALAIGIGASSIISRSLGENNLNKAETTMGNVLSLILISSTIITLLGSIFIVPILKSFGTTETIMPYATDYLSIIIYGSFFFIFAMAMNNIVRSEGNAKVAMYAMIVSAGLNIILDPIFIFGFDMGVKGAAIATVLAQAVGTLYLMYYFISGKSMLQVHAKHLKLKKDIVTETLAIGLGPFSRNASSSLMIIVLNNVLAIYGGDLSIAIFGIVNRLFMFAFMPMFGIIQGLQPIVGYNYGARNYDRVKQSIKLSIIITTAMSTLGFLLLFIFPEQLFSIFSTDQQLISSGRDATRIMVMAVPLVGFQIVGASLYQAIGKARPSFILSMSRQLLFLIPFVLILPHFFDLWGVWIAFPLSDSLSFLVTLIMVLKEFKILNRMEKASLAPDPI
ncbi:MATE family efflux transporter [Methanolobus sp. ZRKC3]|uniref:MATE family efflux transporter n=1 Tax=Methanolobus sp. ZRKC3 TaxID=3125786 RepID=UPI003255A745